MFVMTCGRFQPFHNGHLLFLREAAKREGQLVIGIIVPTAGSDASRAGAAEAMRVLGDRRLEPLLNPFSVVDRVRMVSAVVAGEPWRSKTFVTPLPRPDVYWELIEAMFPAPRVWLLPVTDDPFEATKEQWYKSRGDQVERVAVDLSVSGTLVRQLLATDRQRAFSLMPPAVATMLASPADAARGSER